MLIKIPQLEKEKAGEILGKLDALVDKKRAVVSPNLEDLQSDPALRMAIFRYYTFVLPDTDSMDMRFQAYSLAQEKFGGFVPLSSKNEFLSLLKEKGITENDLWQDSEENHAFSKLESPSIEEFCSSYSYFSLFNIIKKCAKIVARFPDDLKPQMIRDLFFLSKKFSMLCDFSLRELEIYPPAELLPRKYAFIMMKFLRSIMKFSPQELSFSSGFRKISILPEEIKYIMNIKEEDEIVFDSSVEENFSRLFGKSRNRWLLTRDPYPILKENLVFMPDFALDLQSPGINNENESKRIYLEIIGFWRPEYIKKKKEKLFQLSKYNYDIILLIDEKMKKYFSGVRYPIFLYSPQSGKFPLMALENHLSKIEETSFLKSRDKWPVILSTAEKNMEGRLFISAKDLDSLGYLKEEFLRLVKEGKLMKGYTILNSDLIQNEVLEKAKSVDLSGSIAGAEKSLGELGLPLNVINSLGYKIIWKSLLSGSIHKL